MDRAERLLDLVTLLVNAERPVPFRAIREHFPDYAGISAEAAARKFERDKADLLDLGMPLVFVDPDPDAGEGGGEGGYRIPQEAYFLPRLELTPEELGLLSVAGAAARAMEGFPWAAEVGRALEKIGFAAEEAGATEAPLARHLLVDAGLAGDPARVGAAFAALRDALARRKRVHLTYRGLYRDEPTERDVDPWGLFLRDGTWCLYGHCHLRGAPRTFHLDRIAALEVNPSKPRQADFALPADLDLQALARQRPWELALEPAREVTVRLAPHLAFSARALFGDRAQVSSEADGSATVTVTVRHLDALVSHVLGLGEGAVIQGPSGARARIVARLQGALAQAAVEDAA